jgi:hypothetical protein
MIVFSDAKLFLRITGTNMEFRRMSWVELLPSAQHSRAKLERKPALLKRSESKTKTSIAALAFVLRIRRVARRNLRRSQDIHLIEPEQDGCRAIA